MIDLWLTDPPYNVNYGARGKTYKEKKAEGTTDKAGMDDRTILNDNMDDANFRQFLDDAFAAAVDVMKPGAAFYIFHSDSEGYNFRGACRDNNLEVRECLIWNKNSLVLGRKDYQWKHEPCLYGWKDGASHYFVYDRSLTTMLETSAENIDEMDEDALRKKLKEVMGLPSTIIEYDRPNHSAEHPTMKPVGLVSYLISNSSKPNANVLDTFGGSGTTLIACEQLGRHCYMLELDPKYVKVIITRWEKLTGEKAEKLK